MDFFKLLHGFVKVVTWISLTKIDLIGADVPLAMFQTYKRLSHQPFTGSPKLHTFLENVKIQAKEVEVTLWSSNKT